MEVFGTVNWMGSEDEQQSSRAYWDPALHFEALRLAALREGGRNEEPLQQRTRGEILYAHLGTCTQPTQLFAAGAGMQPTPSPLCELAWWSLLGILLYECVRGVILDS